ncbi:MAG TPA: LLM class flavin-dependent oxidoreductase [Chloroflexota bacterium]
MRYGVMVLEDYYADAHGSVAGLYQRLIERAVEAEQLGYAGFWMAEHHFHWYGGAHSVPLVALSAIAARTSTLRLGTAVTLLPYYNPMRVAEELACLDNLSNGRVDVGVGRGFFKIEYDGYEVPMDQSRGRFDENLDILLQAWSDERLTYHGQYHTYDQMELTPRPVQQPHPPVWVATSLTPESYIAVGKRGLPLMVVPYIQTSLDDLRTNIDLYREAYAQAGHPGEPEIFAFMHAFVTDSDDHLKDQIDRYLTRYVDAIREAEGRMRGDRPEVQYGYFKGLMAGLAYVTFDIMDSGDKAFFGTPQRCAETLRRVRDKLGLTYLAILPSFGGLPEADVRRTIRLWQEQVAPVAERGLQAV